MFLTTGLTWVYMYSPLQSHRCDSHHPPLQRYARRFALKAASSLGMLRFC
ncbi:hypothetical protein PDIG_74370 [Penicillium digitatum PHI26]|uniref:Uncharacterized protein n=2 Tax=Penicillium digitatum TaxID=36651 RepID=K9FWS0_PEND2|nr:hypothetical protein PDIP_44850 [Penicillium digitatum Pd1]EKV07163.1 hypothetical protein PDIG_74370 [Penicillium digitatum PHI26]EKV14179.1 hypothetical protein PDIP_44850 [Penicillium digitatum Pd1]